MMNKAMKGKAAVCVLAAMLLATAGAEATDFAGAIRGTGLDGEVVSSCETSGCVQVFFNLRSAPDSLIRCVMALPPAAKWDGRLWGLGNGGPGGNVSPKAVLSKAVWGSAAVHTDMGTSRRVATPTMIRDFGHVATHLMTVAAKAIVRAHYGKAARQTYFKGGSTGGGQGFHEALRYPGDYDGIVSMVPANTRMPLHIYFAWNERQRKDAAGKDLFTAAQLAAVRQAGVEALADEQPLYARGKYLVDSLYTPERERKVLRRAVELDPSLDRPELLARLHRIFVGPEIGGRQIHAGVPFGADVAGGCGNQWMLTWWLPKGRAPWSATDTELLQWEKDYGPDCDAYSSDIGAFLKRGGKLLFCGGLEDSVVPVPSMIAWYEKTAAAQGGPAKFAKGCRFFLMPGHAHGPGRGMRNMGDLDTAIVDWVEKGKEPKTLTATMQDGTLMTVLPYQPSTLNPQPSTLNPQLSTLSSLSYAEVKVKSSLDGEMRPTWFWAPPKPQGKIPLLVALHSWSYDYRGPEPRGNFFRECRARGWAFLAPDFRGPNRTPAACGSDLAVQDIVDAVEWVKARVSVDEDRIYLVGGSGGGMMTILEAGRNPGIWAGCYAGCPISDIARWHDETKAMGDWRARYSAEIEKACGGLPTEKPAEYARRSPLTHLAAARAAGTHVDICEGIHDGHVGSVPVGHAIRAFNALADERDRISEDDIAFIERTETVPAHLAFAGSVPFFGKRKVFLRRTSANVRLTIFDAGHAGNYAEAIDWLSRQRRGAKADWTVPEEATGVGGSTEVTK